MVDGMPDSVGGANHPTIIIPSPVPFKFPKRQISCKTGDSRLRCGNCHKMEFAVHVTPLSKLGVAKPSEIICLTCAKIYQINPQGHLGGGANQEAKT